MGRKGVSKRKAKKLKSPSNNNNVSSNRRDGPSVTLLVKDNGAAPNRSGTDPAAGSNKKNRKGK
jgi:hypothetical protein